MGTARNHRSQARRWGPRAATAGALAAGLLLAGGCARTASTADTTESTTVSSTSTGGGPTSSAPATTTTNSPTGTGMSSDNPIEGPTWTLVSATDKAGNDVPVPADAGATLSISDGKMAIHAGCNTGGGAVEISPSALEVGPIMTTRMACDEARMKLEQTVLGVLGTRSSYQVDGELLTVTNGVGNLIYRNLHGAVDSESPATDLGTTTHTGAESSGADEIVTATPVPTSRFTPLPSTLQPLPLPTHTKQLPSIPEDPRGSTN